MTFNLNGLIREQWTALYDQLMNSELNTHCIQKSVDKEKGCTALNHLSTKQKKTKLEQFLPEYKKGRSVGLTKTALASKPSETQNCLSEKNVNWHKSF